MFVDNKGAIKSCKSKKHRKCNHQKKRKKKEHTTTYKTLHRKQKIEQHQSTSITVMNPCHALTTGHAQ
jgi:hypothetical protein